MTIPSGTKLGRYEIRSQLGAGGMGEVYLAQDTKLDRKVALKVLPADVAADHDRMKRFVQEAKAASALNHPNIVTIHEIDQADSVHFIATEFIDGETLRQRISGGMKLVEILEIAIQTSSALAAAHSAGIIHRDVKPENIMIRRDGIVKVLDFGLAKLAEHSVGTSIDTEAPTRALINTEPGVVMGTAIYMSPEQARGIAVDARTDIFSLGVVLYEMVAGRLPFEGSTSSEVVASILSEKEPQPLARYSRDVPAELERIVSKALRKEREQRYQTTKDLLLDLQSLKQQLDFEAKLERSVPPEQPSSRAGAAQTVSESAPATAAVSTARATSSAEYIVSVIQRHKTSVGVALAALVIVLAVTGYFYFPRASKGPIDSVAILPFANTNGDPNTEYLSDGITESIISSLSQLPQLRVMARSTVFRYKGKDVDPQKVGNDLGVRAVLTGRLIQQGDNLTIRTELVNVSDGTELWGQQYNRKLSDALAIQEEIAKEISGNLRLKLSSEQQSRLTKHYTENPEAYQLYLKGNYYMGKDTLDAYKKAAEYFNQAIEKDPTYALAYAGLADYYGESSRTFAPNELQPKAETLAKKALALDDTLAEAHTQLGLVEYNYDWNWSEAERELKQAIELSPNSALAHAWYSIFLMESGRFDEASTEIRRAQELDPLSLPTNTQIGWIDYYSRRYDQAIEKYRKALDLDPNYPIALIFLGMSYDLKGEFAKAIAELQKAQQVDDTHLSLAALGHVYAVSGNRSEAQRVIEELKELSRQKFDSTYQIAVIYAGLGDKDQAFAYLEKAYEIRSSSMVKLNVDPMLDSLRSDPRFADLVRRVGLPQ